MRAGEVSGARSRAFLEALRERGLRMVLASGTDEIYMREEADLLDVSRYFDGVHGALDDYRSFSKRILIERILATPASMASSCSASETGTWKSKR